MEKIDQRFKLEDLNKGRGKMKKSIGSVMNALEGEVKLSKNRAHLGHFTPGINQIDPTIFSLGEMCQDATNNSITGINLSLSYIRETFYPQLNIKEAIKYDEYNYNNKVKTQERVIIGNTNRKERTFG